jgi:hypothetical protein
MHKHSNKETRATLPVFFSLLPSSLPITLHIHTTYCANSRAPSILATYSQTNIQTRQPTKVNVPIFVCPSQTKERKKEIEKKAGKRNKHTKQQQQQKILPFVVHISNYIFTYIYIFFTYLICTFLATFLLSSLFSPHCSFWFPGFVFPAVSPSFFFPTLPVQAITNTITHAQHRENQKQQQQQQQP